ncbi:hypothetical protein [Paraburkholderia aromaticivorans]|uniref:hypothetical protein n=1 Tax=Paraburkholderia aromaticivorans TaxID=2026199 RepID=UPI00145601D8|nr:hypothetical protein [Paraburkholderia aromaticivorans]
MPLQVKSAKIQPGTTTTFEFDDQITQRMIGMSAFSLSYGNTDHHLQTVMVSLNANHAGKTLSITANAMMIDAGGHNLDPAASSVTVVALAWVGVDDSNLKLGNVAGISNGGTSSPIAIPGTDPNVLQAALTGFSLSYGATDHHMEAANASVGTEVSGNAATVKGTVYMRDDSGNANVPGTVDAGLVANCDPSLGSFVRSVDMVQQSSKKLTFSQPYATYTPFLNSFQVQYGVDSDHHVKTFTVVLNATGGGGAVADVSGGVTLIDDSGHSQNNAVSHVSGFVVGAGKVSS